MVADFVKQHACHGEVANGRKPREPLWQIGYHSVHHDLNPGLARHGCRMISANHTPPAVPSHPSTVLAGIGFIRIRQHNSGQTVHVARMQRKEESLDSRMCPPWRRVRGAVLANMNHRSHPAYIPKHSSIESSDLGLDDRDLPTFVRIWIQVRINAH